MTETELREALKNIAHSNLLLRLENDVFERYLERRDPESLRTIAQVLETAKRVQKIAPQRSYTSPVMSAAGSAVTFRDKDSLSIASIPSGSHITPSLLAAKAAKKVTKITYAQRIEMVNTEMRELQEELVNLEQTLRKKKIYLRAQMEESEISIRETCRAREEFEENVVQKGVDGITGKIPAEKFTRFIEEWLKVLDIIMERIRLKIITLKSQIQKVNLQLKHRKEFGEALRAIDFEQLNIENQDCIRRIEEKNQYLLEMKRITGRYSIALTKHKEKLGGLISTVNEVRNKIASKNKKITKLQSDQTMMQIEIEKMEEQHKSITELMNNFHVPRVIDFVKMRAELHELRRIHKQLTRQRKIQQITLKLNRH
uniref:Cilia- and flagella-associated protein 263 n=1 Tax=Ooceraea biroi TaxID=2015173 RepID=A0A3L8DI89_OOCBI|nr:hypothetical protein DMN91_006642 [Ooceraea biroi]